MFNNMYGNFEQNGLPQPQFNNFGYNYPPQTNAPQKGNQTNVEWLQMNSVEEVEKIPVQRGQELWIMLTNEPVFAVRKADTTGQATTEYYKFERFVPQKAVEPEYVTKDDFIKFMEDFKKELNSTKPSRTQLKKEGNE